MAYRPNTVLAKSARPFPFYQLVAALVSVLVFVAIFGAFGLAQQLRRTCASDDGFGASLPTGFFDPFLLALLGSVAALSALSLWIIARYERRLEVFAESRARNRAIVDNMLDGVIHIDAEGSIAGINAAAERMFGYSSAELRGQPVSLLFASPQREQLEAEMDANPDLGLPPTLVGRHQTQVRERDGRTRTVSLAVTEVHVGGYLVYTAIVREPSPAPQPWLDAVSSDDGT